MDRQASGALTSRAQRLPPALSSPLTAALAALAERLAQQPDWQGRIAALRELQELLSQPADEALLAGLRRAPLAHGPKPGVPPPGRADPRPAASAGTPSARSGWASSCWTCAAR